ncbi:MAG TPA: DUF6285 domain-containing protein [Planctomycetota bacterium]|nr:DUF6285 domain-containing protein [Planctomycetota bacterium]
MSGPSREEVLEAVARFLEEDVKPVAKEPALAFRVLVAGSLLRSVALETRDSESREAREVASLRALVAPHPGPPPAARGEGDGLRALLCEKIRARAFSAAELARVRAHVRESLVQELAYTAPRFDTGAKVE